VFLEAGERSVNLRPAGGGAPTVVSDRALERLYNVDVVVRAFARAREHLPDARLVIAGDGNERGRLEAMAREVAPEGSVRFMGRLEPAELAQTLADAHVYVSVPSSDSLALSTVEAMAAGCFPVISDLASNEGWLTHRYNALLVPPRDDALLAGALHDALSDETMRRAAAGPNRAKAEAEGLRERNMLRMESLYYRLAAEAAYRRPA
jgi:glycosyltransferase involved in cell wall biosynthesis